MMRDLHAMVGWAFTESRAVARLFRERQLWVALLGCLLLWMLAYQIPYDYRIDVGGNRQTGRQDDDAPFLTDFNASEPDSLDAHPDAVPFRWASADSTITLPGIGGGRWNVAITAVSGRADGSSVTSRWDDGATTAVVTIDALPRVYQFAAAADAAGDLTLHTLTPPLDAPSDPRSLGFVLFRVGVGAAGGQLPAWRQLVWLAIALLLVYALLRRLACVPREALAIAIALATIAAILLARERMALTLMAPRLPLILAGCYALATILDPIYWALPADAPLAHYQERADRRRPGSRADERPAPPGLRNNEPARGLDALVERRLAVVGRRSSVVGLVVLALALRLGGMLHPHALFSDLGLHRHNLQGVAMGEIYFTEGLPSEAGGGRAPYPPGQYLTLAPALLALPGDDAALNTLLKVGNALVDSLVVGLVWYLLRRSGCGSRAALLGAALYALPPPMLKSLLVGELANVFGQALALAPLGLLTLRARRPSTKPAFAALAALLGLALLSHLGVTISLFCVLGFMGLAWLIRLETRRSLQALILAVMLIGGLVALFYYTSFADILGGRLTGAAPAEPALVLDTTTKLRNEIELLLIRGVHPLLVTLGMTGTALIALRPRVWHRPWHQPALGSLLIAWWGGSLLSLGLLLFASQGVRWQQFLYPALCLGAGPALAAIWPHGRAGRLVVATLLAFLLWYGLAFWVTQVRDYLH
jgi:hypothetical protein